MVTRIPTPNEVAEFLRRMSAKLGRNAKCWCGSGKKYKRCHLDREAQSPLGRQEMLESFNRLFEEGNCLHPDASRTICTGKIIKSHTIQRNGGLSRIARNGHVYNALKHGPMFDASARTPARDPHLVGVRQASTFTGFCARHDNQLFAPVETKPLDGSPLQIALFGYRAICYELYMKERDLAGSDIRRDLDKGQPLHIQQKMQEAFFLHDIGVKKALMELNLLKRQYDRMLFKGGLDDLDYYVLTFRGSPEVMCSATHQSTHDFLGNCIHTLGNLTIPASWMTYSLIATDDGGAAIFSWPADHRKSEAVARTLPELPDADLPHAIIRFTFEFFENTYFSPDWWDGLERRAQTSLMERQLREIGVAGPLSEFPRPDDCLSDDGVRTVSWPVVSRLTTLSDI